MKREALWAACVIILVDVGSLTLRQGYAQDAVQAGNGKATCSLATLRGTYLFAGSGFTIEGGDQVPLAAAGYEVYHGDGTQNFVASFSANGVITRHARVSGTHTINADCTGTATYTDGTHFDLFIAPDGSMYTYIQTDPGVVLSGVVQRGTARLLGD